MSKSEAFIIDGIRTPIGKLKGSLSSIRADDLAAIPIKELLKRNPELDPASVEDVILGCANQAGEDNRNVARMAALLAGLPVSVPGETVNRLCASGMSATIRAFHAIKAGEGDVFLTGGVEHMTRGPIVLGKGNTPYSGTTEMYDSTFGWRFVNPKMHEMHGTDGMGMTAENVVEMHKISREDQDKFAAWSQQKAGAARDSGRLAKEIVKVEIPQRKGDPIVFEHDEFMRPDSTAEILGKLRPAFKKDGSVTAGNASGLNDGAGALLIASGSAVEKYGFKPKARIVASAVSGIEPRIMGLGPVEATQKALKRAGLSLDDMDIIELNEAFAGQSLGVTRKLGLKDNDSRLNPNGGAIAIGHPLGMTGQRLLQTATIELHENSDSKYALCTLCVGVGQGFAVVLEVVK
ncbi:MAG: 3-oxoadipyl-CoA thiolase [Balneola sp.]|jgi:acetyl-CoA acyltransferase|nr:3-oxoadipyl-CoA thiolase [Balneola sp.]MAO77619.1 3-oxoadipyl-CoA thiolase [Balneola sp.]MBF64816.1 3-oxoadipyl-CoA thiolase [Balneola sp.]|tara:strand:- start:3235 stop:4452 length:1218 start_codon:yes stop_codon:yes gene_type:complete